MDDALIQKITNMIGDLPSMPLAAQQALALLSDPSTEPEALQAVLSKDPPIALKVLRMANSAYYSRSRQVDSLAAGIVLLGFKTLQSIVLSSAVQQVLSEAGPLWDHCFCVAAACRELSRKHRNLGFDLEEAFLAGLFHDIGKGAIASKFPGVYDSQPTLDEEVELLGFNHAHLGGAIIDSWELPKKFVEAVGGHHDEDADGLSAATAVCDWLCWELAPGLGSPPGNPKALTTLEISEDAVGELRSLISDILSGEDS